MWVRNLLFCGLCACGLVALAATLLKARPDRKPRAGRLPAAQQATLDRTVSKIDAAFRQSWEEAGLEPAGQADDLLVARRLSLALEGTIPSLEEIRQFEAHGPEDRIDWWLRGIFADRRYSDYMSERFARAWVGTEQGPFLLYRRRRFVSWLADQLHENRRYDRIVRDLIADTGLWTDKPATNFITVSLKQDEGNKVDENKLAGRVSRAFLGIRLDCAQCHDHPFEDQWKQDDFQSLAAYFGNTEMSIKGIRDVHGPYKAERRDQDDNIVEVAVSPQVPFPEVPIEDNGSNRHRLARWVTHAENQYFARATVNRVWALMLGRPLVEPVDDIPTEGPYPAALELLAEDFALNGYDLHRLIRAITATEVFRMESRADHEITADHEALWAVFPITRLRPEQVVGSMLQSASLRTIDYQSHIIVRIARAIGQNEFVERYGDVGEAELEATGGTIPQRLLLMNGELVHEKTKDNLIGNASTRIGQLAPDDASAIETAYLSLLTRRPSDIEAEHFTKRLLNTKGDARNRVMADLYWALVNGTEFSWNH